MINLRAKPGWVLNTMTHAQDRLKQRCHHMHIDNAHPPTFYLGSSCLIPWCQLRLRLSQHRPISAATAQILPAWEPCLQTLQSVIYKVSTLTNDGLLMWIVSIYHLKGGRGAKWSHFTGPTLVKTCRSCSRTSRNRFSSNNWDLLERNRHKHIHKSSYPRRRAGAGATTRGERRATTSPGYVSQQDPSFSLPPGGNSAFQPELLHIYRPAFIAPAVTRSLLIHKAATERPRSVRAAPENEARTPGGSDKLRPQLLARVWICAWAPVS